MPLKPFWSVQLNGLQDTKNVVQLSTLSNFMIFPSLCKKTIYSLSSHTPFPALPSALGNHDICFLSAWTSLLQKFHNNGDTRYVPSFPEDIVFKIHPCWSMYQYFIFMFKYFVVWLHFLCIYSSHYERMSCSHFLDIVNHAVMNIRV